MGFGHEASSSGYGLDASGPLLLPVRGNDNPQVSSQPKTFANVFIAIVGAGVLGLPYTFSRTGWAAGAILLLAVAALTFHCMMLLVRTRRRLDLERSAKIASFGDLGLAVYGSPGRLAVDAMIVLSQAGFCVGYLIFISNSLAHLLPLSIPFLSSKSVYVLAMLPFQLGLNSIKTLTLLAPLSIFADIVDLGAMGVIIGEDVSIMLSNPLPSTHSPAPLSFSTALASPSTPLRESAWFSPSKLRPLRSPSLGGHSASPWPSLPSSTDSSVCSATPPLAMRPGTSSPPTSAPACLPCSSSWASVSTSSLLSR